MTGDDIRRARKCAGLRQLDVARRVGVTRSAVSRWERGLDIPSPEHQAALATVLGDC